MDVGGGLKIDFKTCSFKGKWWLTVVSVFGNQLKFCFDYKKMRDLFLVSKKTCPSYFSSNMVSSQLPRAILLLNQFELF